MWPYRHLQLLFELERRTISHNPEPPIFCERQLELLSAIKQQYRLSAYYNEHNATASDSEERCSTCTMSNEDVSASPAAPAPADSAAPARTHSAAFLCKLACLSLSESIKSAALSSHLLCQSTCMSLLHGNYPRSITLMPRCVVAHSKLNAVTLAWIISRTYLRFHRAVCTEEKELEAGDEATIGRSSGAGSLYNLYWRHARQPAGSAKGCSGWPRDWGGQPAYLKLPMDTKFRA